MSDLLKLNSDRHWWTVGSQPAVDGADSTSPEFGFGPEGGYIYQKAFVEFFCPRRHVDALVAEVEALGRGTRRQVTYYAAPRKDGDFRTNMAEGDANAVTWGVFPGKEIATTTIIEEMSFKAWRVSRHFNLRVYALSLGRMRPSQSGRSGNTSTPSARRRVSCCDRPATSAGSSASFTTTIAIRVRSGASSIASGPLLYSSAIDNVHS